jgi:hypothetical protein
MKSIKNSKKKRANKSTKSKNKFGTTEKINANDQDSNLQVTDKSQFEKMIVNKHCLSAIQKVEDEQELTEHQIDSLSKILMRGEANARCSYYLFVKSRAHETLGLSQRQFFLQYTNCSISEGYKHCRRGELEYERFNSAVYIGTYNGAVLDAFISIRKKHGVEMMLRIWDELDRHIASNEVLQLTGPLIEKALLHNLDLKELEEDVELLDSKSISEQEVISTPTQDYKLLDPKEPDYIVSVLDTIINDDELVNSLDAAYILIIRKKLNTALKKVKSFL